MRTGGKGHKGSLSELIFKIKSIDGASVWKLIYNFKKAIPILFKYIIGNPNKQKSGIYLPNYIKKK